VRRFFHANETLVKIISLVFAAAGFLRAQPKEDAVVVMQCLLIVVGVVIYVRLWSDLPRRYVVLPGEHWTIGLIVTYYCLTIILVVAILYLTAGFVEQRHRYLGVALGTLLAVAGVSLLTRWVTAEQGDGRTLLRRLGVDERDWIAGVVVTVLLVAVIVGAYAVASVASPPVNTALDRVFGPPPVATSR
jgi:hypothetical protein